MSVGGPPLEGFVWNSADISNKPTQKLLFWKNFKQNSSVWRYVLMCKRLFLFSFNEKPQMSVRPKCPHKVKTELNLRIFHKLFSNRSFLKMNLTIYRFWVCSNRVFSMDSTLNINNLIFGFKRFFGCDNIVTQCDTIVTSLL